MTRFNCILENKLYIHYVRKIEEYEKTRIFCKHDIEHSLSVSRIMYLKSLKENLNFSEDVLYAIGLLHDVGRVLQYENNTPHALASVEIAKEILLSCSYTDEEINIICDAVSKHNDTSESDTLATLLKYADKASRNCFLCSAFDECNWSESKKNKGVIL